MYFLAFGNIKREKNMIYHTIEIRYQDDGYGST